MHLDIFSFLHEILNHFHHMKHHLLLIVSPNDLNPQGTALRPAARLSGQAEGVVGVGRVVSLQRRLVPRALPAHWEDASRAANQVVDCCVARG